MPAAVVALALGLVAAGIFLLVHYDVFGGSSGSTAVVGSGVAASEARELPAFDGVELAGSNDVTVHVGARQSVVVRGDDNLLSRVTTRVQAGTLVIGNTPGSFTARSPMSVDVVAPSLDTMTLSGSGAVSAAGIHADRVSVTLSGSGVLRATGTVGRLDVALAGSGDAQLESLVARHARAVLSGSGRILLDVTQSLDASVPGSGAIVYGGDPAHVQTSVTGSGAIARG